jgi:sulfur relay protein TusB/DsrH
MIILSDYDASKLGIASEIVNKTHDKRVMLLSDALYLLCCSDLNEVIEGMLRAGATFYALEADVKRRGVKAAAKHIIATTYDEFVRQLLKQSGGVINI